MATILDGAAVAAALRAEIRTEVERFRAAHGYAPALATVLVGAHPASAAYVRGKRRACAEAGITALPHELPADIPQADLERLVHALNARADVHGILVQLPLPPPLDAAAVLAAVHPEKDVDGLHPANQARLLLGQEGLRPCTPLGIMRLLAATGRPLAGARAVVIGRSTLVGKPAALLLLEQHATVTICHSRTRDLAAEVAAADVLVAAIGRPEFVRGAWIRPGSVVIDVGINRLPDGRLVGDVEFAAACERAGFITPVPGGVGPMTVAMLLHNTLTAARRQAGLSPA